MTSKSAQGGPACSSRRLTVAVTNFELNVPPENWELKINENHPQMLTY